MCAHVLNCVYTYAPTHARTQSHGISEEEVINKIMLEPMPKKAFISMEELVGTTLFLSSSAARNMTGQALLLDGGWTVR